MSFEISSAVNAQNYSSTEKSAAAVSSGIKTETQEPRESVLSSIQNYSAAAAEKKVSESGQAGSSGSGKEKDQPTEKEVKSKIDMANNELRHAKTGLNFKYHEATKRVSITVYDKETKEVIREIPPEKTLDMLEKMWELAGMVVDDRR